MEESIKYFLMPSNLVTLFLLLGGVLGILKYRRLAASCFIFSLSIFLILGSGPVSQYLLANLEYRFTPYEEANHTSVKTIAVLTGGSENKPGVSLSSVSNISSSYRIIEAGMIFHAQAGRNIILSGNANTAHNMKQEMMALGIPESAINLDAPANSTLDSALNLSKKLSNTDFILVTSAGHMPRAMAAFESAGLHPVPAPTEFIAHQNILASSYLPNAHHLVNADLAIHEHLALLWYKWRTPD